MNNTNDEKLIAGIKLGEGFRESAYQDSLGYWTIGYGKMIDARKGGKLTEDICELILINEIKECYAELQGYAWFVIQDEVRQGVLVELCFNLGMPHLLEFQNMISCLKVKNYTGAASELLNSEWAKQDQKSRVADIKYRLETGCYAA